MRIVFQACDNYRRNRGDPFKIKLQVFKKKICLHLYNKFVSVQVLGILFPTLNESKISQSSYLIHKSPKVAAAKDFSSSLCVYSW